MNIVFLDSATLNPEEIDFTPLDELGHLDIYPKTDSTDIVSRSLSADVLITNKCIISKEIISALPRLKMIQLAATGYNNVDIKFAQEKGIRVCNVSGYSTTSVSQHVFAMLLSYLHQTQFYNQAVKTGRWKASGHFSFWDAPFQSLEGKTMGIFGFGMIGQSVAQIAAAFGMNVLVSSRTKRELADRNMSFCDLNFMLSNSDIISLHAPYNESTHEMINRKSLSLMKSSAILINTARGGLINEEDLYAFLDDHKIEAALLDVLSTEPPENSHPLIGLSNCFITPHQAWANLKARARLLIGMVENIKGFQKGTPQNVIV